MRRNVLLTDLGIALLVVIIVLVITPGLAIAGVLALVVLGVCVFTFVRKTRRAQPARARRPPRR